MGRKRLGPSSSVPERNRQFARHLNRLLFKASLEPGELAALLGRTEVLMALPTFEWVEQWCTRAHYMTRKP